jgi:hypothetical protein
MRKLGPAQVGGLGRRAVFAVFAVLERRFWGPKTPSKKKTSAKTAETVDMTRPRMLKREGRVEDPVPAPARALFFDKTDRRPSAEPAPADGRWPRRGALGSRLSAPKAAAKLPAIARSGRLHSAEDCGGLPRDNFLT